MVIRSENLDVLALHDLDLMSLLETMGESLAQVNEMLEYNMPTRDRRAIIKIRTALYKAIADVEDAHDVHMELYDKYWK